MEISYLTLLLYIGSFLTLWIGSGAIVYRVTKLSHGARLSPFVVSYFVLGLLTSLPEIIIGGISVVEEKPLIFVGNLIGSVPIIFLGIIPILGILSPGIKIPQRLTFHQIIFALLVVLMPALISIDKVVSIWEGWALVCAYGALSLFMLRTNTFSGELFFHPRKQTVLHVVIIFLWCLILYTASRYIVATTQQISEIFAISPFIVSLLVISLGTNLPELSLVFRAVIAKKSDIAIGDYLGSASANTLIFGLCTIAYGKSIVLPGYFWGRFILLGFGLFFFYTFARSKREITKTESLFLLCLYGLFVASEILFP